METIHASIITETENGYQLDTIPDDEWKEVKEIMDCPKCGGKIIEKKTKRGKIFYYRSSRKNRFLRWEILPGSL
jgi:ssDNA-binding Zn-finger/Zn-ribbon topoisomerase 1